MDHCPECGELLRAYPGICAHCGVEIIVSDDATIISSVANPAIPGGFLTAVDKDIIDYEPGRSLSDLALLEAIQSVVAGCKWVCYAETPFFEQLNALQGTPQITASEDPLVYERHRNALFNAQREAEVVIHGLVFTQPNVNKPAVDHLVAQLQCANADDPAFVVRYGTADYLMDGHHRTIAAFLEGKETIVARVIDFDRPETIMRALPLQ